MTWKPVAAINTRESRAVSNPRTRLFIISCVLRDVDNGRYQQLPIEEVYSEFLGA